MSTSPVRLTPPSTKTNEILQKIAKYEAPSSGAPSELESEWPLVWEEGKGAEITDVEGNTYVDLTAGFSVANLGYCHPKWVEAVTEQLKKLTHCRSRSPNIPRAILLEKLAKLDPIQDGKIHFATGGAEAVEVAWKMTKLYCRKHEILSFFGSWHGRTHATLSLSGVKSAKQGVNPLVAGTVFVPYPYCYRCTFKLELSNCGCRCIDYIETTIKDYMAGNAEIAAIIVEPIQGYGGHIVPPNEFLSNLRRICNENNLVFIVDEIYTGFGRTGKMFAVEHYNVIPDVHILGKGMTSGFPFSAVVGKSEIMDAGRDKIHSMTFQANPVLCAAAIASLKILQEEKLVENSAVLGQYFLKRLCELAESNEIIGDVRGKGLLIGVELVEDRRTKEPPLKKTNELTLFTARRGVIIDTAARSNILRITPPLVITQEQIDRAVDILELAFRSLK